MLEINDGNIHIVDDSVNVVIDEKIINLRKSQSYYKNGYVTLYLCNQFFNANELNNEILKNTTLKPKEGDVLYTYCDDTALPSDEIIRSNGSDLQMFQLYCEGTSVQAPARIDLSAIGPDLNVPVNISILQKNKVINAIKIYRRIGNGSWNEVTQTFQGNGIQRVDFTSDPDKIIVYLNILEQQDFIIVVQINKHTNITNRLWFETDAVTNDTNSNMIISSVTYNVKNKGITNVQNSGCDFLNRFVSKIYGIASNIKAQYSFLEPYVLKPGHKLVLHGYQKTNDAVYSIVNSDEFINCTEYGEIVMSYIEDTIVQELTENYDSTD